MGTFVKLADRGDEVETREGETMVRGSMQNEWHGRAKRNDRQARLQALLCLKGVARRRRSNRLDEEKRGREGETEDAREERSWGFTQIHWMNGSWLEIEALTQLGTSGHPASQGPKRQLKTRWD